MDLFLGLVRSPAVPQVETGAMMVGPDLARRWLNECQFSAQRSLYSLRVRLYQNEMAGGLWRLSELRFARTPDGHAYLMNGYTRLTAVIQGGTEVPFIVTVVDVATMQDVAKEYSVMDAHRVRQTKDMLRGFDLEGQLGFGLSAQDTVARTAPIISAGFLYQRYGRLPNTIQFRLPFLMDWAEHARVLFAALHTGHEPDPPAKRLTNAPIFSVALVAARFQPEQAGAFYRSVAANDGLRRGQPDWILRQYLSEMSTSTVRDYPAMERRTAACWNAYFEGRDISFARAAPTHQGEWAPIRIAGTPYDGRSTIFLYGNGAHIPGSEPEDQTAEAIYERATRSVMAHARDVEAVAP